MRKMLATLLIGVALAGGAPPPEAQAQWVKGRLPPTLPKDAILIRLAGQVKAGEAADTTLSFTGMGGKHALVWDTPLTSGICGGDQLRITAKFGQRQPERLIFQRFEEGRRIILLHKWDILSRLAETERLQLQITDHCGKTAAVEFRGSPLAHVPALRLVAPGSDWRIEFPGYFTKEQGDAGVQYRQMNDGRDDLFLFIAAPENLGRDFERQVREERRAQVTINGVAKDFRMGHGVRFLEGKLAGTGRLNIHISSAWSRQELAAAIDQDPVALIEFEGRSYRLDLSGFREISELD